MRRVKRKLGGLSLRHRLIISSVLCVLLPSLITIVVSSYLTKDTLEQRAIKQSKDTLSMIELSISGYFNNLLNISNYIQFNSEINSILKGNLKDAELQSTSQLGGLQHAKITKNLENVMAFSAPTYITILLPNGAYYTNYSTYEYDPENFFKQSWFNKIEKQNFYESYWIGGHQTYIHSRSNENPYLMTIVRTMQISGNTYGYIIVSVNEKEISNVFQQFTESSGQQFMLIDSNGTILSHPNSKNVSKDLTHNEHLSLKQTDWGIVTQDEKEYLMVNHPISFSDWELVSLVPYKETVGDIGTISRTTLLIQFIFFSIFLVVLIYLVKEFTEPIAKLSRTVEEVEKGNLQIRSGIRGEADIAKLGSSFDKMLNRIQDMIKQIKIEETYKRKAELEMLQAQVNPHFLFNVLNSIRLKIILKGDKESASLIQSLSLLLRMTINRNNEFIALKEEIEIVHHYVKLMNFRHQEHLELISHVDAEILQEEVPRFFIQPLIENALIHGFDREGGKVFLSAWLKEESLFIRIKDNGRGMTDKELENLKDHIFHSSNNEYAGKRDSFTGIGVKNVYQRLMMIYGANFHMEITSKRNEGTEFMFYIPLKK